MWTHINFPSLSRRDFFFFYLFPRMVCSAHHRPRGMCSCLAIIKMSYSWADRQEKSSVTFFFKKGLNGREFLLCFYGPQILFDSNKTINPWTWMSLWGRFTQKCFILSAPVAAQSTFKLFFFIFTENQMQKVKKYCFISWVEANLSASIIEAFSLFILSMTQGFSGDEFLQRPPLTSSPATGKTNYYASGELVDMTFHK